MSFLAERKGRRPLPNATAPDAETTAASTPVSIPSTQRMGRRPLPSLQSSSLASLPQSQSTGVALKFKAMTPKENSVWMAGSPWTLNEEDAFFQTMVRGALFAPPGRAHRMRLIRQWDNENFVLFIMHNPSIADERRDDPTTEKLIRYAQSWGYGGLLIGNLATMVASDPNALKHATTPLIEKYNDSHITFMALHSKMVILAYGQPAAPSLRGEGLRIARMLKAHTTTPISALELSNDGTPKHPLYLRSDKKPVPFEFVISEGRRSLPTK
jgi:hypothetical protein